MSTDLLPVRLSDLLLFCLLDDESLLPDLLKDESLPDLLKEVPLCDLLALETALVRVLTPRDAITALEVGNIATGNKQQNNFYSDTLNIHLIVRWNE